MKFDPYIAVNLDGEEVLITGVDTNSYVSETGRTWLIPNGENPADNAEEIESQILASMVPDISAIKTELKSRATQRRWEIETAGVMIGNIMVSTDDRAKTLLTAADRKARRDSNYSTSWKGVDGVWTDIDSNTVITIADVVFNHVNSCFSREKALHADIDSASDVQSLDSLRPVIETFWT